MNSTYGQLNPGFRLLMGPGPVETAPRVLRAMSSNMLGHLDPQFIEIMNETMSLLRYVFQTQNQTDPAHVRDGKRRDGNGNGQPDRTAR